MIRIATRHGKLALVPEPVGTRGYDDLKRTAGREHLGQGLRPLIASTQDLGRMLNTLNRPDDPANSAHSAASNNSNSAAASNAKSDLGRAAA